MSYDKCTLLGGWFATTVQIVLASVCVLTLVIKREYEIPRRAWRVWFLDVLKQGIGSSSDHMTNILISILIISGSEGDECQWYFLVYTLTSTIGCTTNLLMLTLVERLSTKYKNSCTAEIRNFGEYGDPPKLKRWFVQLIVWLGIVVVSKIIVLVVLILCGNFLIYATGSAFASFDGNRAFELIFVMIIIPFILNIIQFWITDTFLKHDNHSPSQFPSTDRIDDHEGSILSIIDKDVSYAIILLLVLKPPCSPIRSRLAYYSFITRETFRGVCLMTAYHLILRVPYPTVGTFVRLSRRQEPLVWVLASAQDRACTQDLKVAALAQESSV